jgi:hypothetical protein
MPADQASRELVVAAEIPCVVRRGKSVVLLLLRPEVRLSR